MEKVIDRKEYRRNNGNDKVEEDVKIEIVRNRLKEFLFQSLGAAILLLIASFLKFYDCTEILYNINNGLDSKISLSSLQESGLLIYNEAIKYYTKLNDIVEKVLDYENFSAKNFEKNNFAQGSGEEKNKFVIDFFSGDLIETQASSTNSFISGSFLESAVEGINQMSEDAKYINENYELIVPVIGTITSKFGVRNSDNPKVSSYHSGLDIAANTGTQVLAALDGEVIEATTDTYYGKFLKIKRDDITMIYAHCSKLLVKVGDKIKKGDLIAYVGNTGNSTGSHLHFEIKYEDRLVNPIDVIDVK